MSNKEFDRKKILYIVFFSSYIWMLLIDLYMYFYTIMTLNAIIISFVIMTIIFAIWFYFLRKLKFNKNILENITNKQEIKKKNKYIILLNTFFIIVSIYALYNTFINLDWINKWEKTLEVTNQVSLNYNNSNYELLEDKSNSSAIYSIKSRYKYVAINIYTIPIEWNKTEKEILEGYEKWKEFINSNWYKILSTEIKEINWINFFIGKILSNDNKQYSYDYIMYSSEEKKTIIFSLASNNKDDIESCFQEFINNTFIK